MLTFLVFAETLRHDFLNYDDNKYVTENPHVLAGLSLQGIIWAFRSTYAANWHPLTWISHMLDVELFGLKPWGHHLTSVLLHTVNAVFLFLLLYRMTGFMWRSWFVAALFAVHPVHLESVAWVAERKDVLSTFFWLLTMWAYTRYVEWKQISPKHALLHYAATIVFFALGLMSKPMLVTLPFVLLLLDYWPLRRWVRAETVFKVQAQIIEKIPFFLLSGASCVLTFVAQRHGGAVTTFQQFPLGVRLSNAAVSYVGYVWKAIFPLRLSIFYPHPGPSVPLWEVVICCIFLAIASGFVVLTMRRRPYLATGWFWYLGTLVPVIGIVQVGAQSMADRYTYVPLIGLFIIVAWGVPDLLEQKVGQVLVSGQASKMCGTWVIAGLVVVSLAASASIQANYWRNNVSLFRHAIAVTKHNYLAHNNLGFALAEQGDAEGAIRHYLRALTIKPDFSLAHNNLGLALAQIGDYEKAIEHYQEALRQEPDSAAVYNNLGVALIGMGRLDQAIEVLSQALRIQPEYAEAYTNLGIAYFNQGDIESAIVQYKKALEYKPNHAPTHSNLGAAYARSGNFDAAIAECLEALRIEPGFADAHANLGLTYSLLGRWGDAIREYREALRIKPGLVQAHRGLAVALASAGDYSGAWEEVKWCRRNGVPLDQDFITALSHKMPEPGADNR